MLKQIKYFPYLIRQYYYISRFEKWRPEKIERFQVKAFRKIFESAKKTSIYKDLYEKIGVFNLKIKSLEDIKKLPVIDKTWCREKGLEDHFVKARIPGTMLQSTTGSTGKPFQIRIPVRIEMVPPLKVIYAMRQFGWRPFYKGLEIWQDNSSTHKNFMRKTGLLKLISFFNPLSEIRKKIEEVQPDYLFSIRTFYSFLVDYFQETGYHYKPKFILCTAEEVHAHHRNKLEEYFQAKLIDIYGIVESPTIAYTCPEHDRFHVFQTTVIAEVINKRLIEGEEYGDLVITNLTNDVMPFIRYRTGDIVKVVNGPCQCRRKSQVLGEIQGRSDDSVKLASGEIITLYHFSRAFRNVIEIDQYRAVCSKSTGEVVFQFKLKRNVDKESALETLNELFRKNFSNYKFQLRIVDGFEVPKSGKSKVFEVIE